MGQPRAMRVRRCAREIAVDQIRTVSKSRLTRQIGRIDAAATKELREAIALLYAAE